MIWFTSDTHFNHKMILKYSNRVDFLSKDILHERNKNPSRWRPTQKAIDQFDDYFIKQINKYVKPKDTLWHLGDFCFPSNEHSAKEYRKRINCRNINLIFGNHDSEKIGSVFKEAYHYKEIRHDRIPIVLSHYAHAVWNKSHVGSWMIYGHSHTTAEKWLDDAMPERKSIDIGVDNSIEILNEYRPFSFKDLYDILNNKKGCSIDKGKSHDF